MRASNPVIKAAFSANRFFLGQLSSLDKSLEENGVLPKLGPQQLQEFKVELSDSVKDMREKLAM